MNESKNCIVRILSYLGEPLIYNALLGVAHQYRISNHKSLTMNCMIQWIEGVYWEESHSNHEAWSFKLYYLETIANFWEIEFWIRKKKINLQVLAYRALESGKRNYEWNRYANEYES